MAAQIIGFGDVNETENETHVKKKKIAGVKKCGGFQGMGLSFPVLKGIQKRGYKLPTPIQRKVKLITSYPYRCFCFVVVLMYCESKYKYNMKLIKNFNVRPVVIMIGQFRRPKLHPQV